jgi:hypothetical protein
MISTNDEETTEEIEEPVEEEAPGNIEMSWREHRHTGIDSPKIRGEHIDIVSGIDHGGIGGLADDDHTQYPLLTGRSGGQTLKGGTGSGDNLTFNSTSHATKGKINLGGSSAFDEVNTRLGIGITTPDGTGHFHTASAGSVTANPAVDDLVAENSAGGGMSILTPDNAYKQIAFGGPDDAYAGIISYGGPSVATAGDRDAMAFFTNGTTARVKIDSAGKVYILTGVLDMGTHQINNVTDPTSAQDAATKNYVDSSQPIILGAMKDETVGVNQFVRQVTYDTDIYWGVSALVDANEGRLGWASKPAGFGSYFTHDVSTGPADTVRGIVQIGSYVYVSDRDAANETVYRYDAKTFANKTAMTLTSGTGTTGLMAYDGTYLYIIDSANVNRARRYTISGTNYSQDTNWADDLQNYKTLPENADRGFWADSTNLYTIDSTDKKIYKITISSLAVADSVALDTNTDMSNEKGCPCGVFAISNQFYMAYDVHDEWGTATSYTRPTTIVCYPFTF